MWPQTPPIQRPPAMPLIWPGENPVVCTHGNVSHTYVHTRTHIHTIIGNFKTQAISNIISSICAIVLVFSTWQYTLNQPSCCPTDSPGNVTLSAGQAEGCDELQRNILLSRLNLHISPAVNITISIIALVVWEPMPYIQQK